MNTDTPIYEQLCEELGDPVDWCLAIVTGADV